MTGTAPPVPQIPAGYAPFPADLNAWVTTPFTFLATKAVFRGQLQGAEALSAGSPTLAKLDTVPEDPYSGWSATATASQAAWSWLCPAGCSGWYEVTLTALTASQGVASSAVGAELYVDGSLYQQASMSQGVNGNSSGSEGSVLVPLIGGSDYLQMYIYSLDAVNTPALAGRYPSMEIAWIGS
jgi:hypothetical protein